MSYTIKDVPTRALLTALDRCRRCEEDGSLPDHVFVHRRPAAVPGGFETVSATRETIRLELRGRPHVSGKAEAKLLRRLMSTTGWTERQLRAHPKFGEQLADAQFPNRRVIDRGPYVKDIQKRFGKHFGKVFKVS